VGAIDIHERHLLVDVKAEHAELIGKKLTGIKVKGELLAPALATPGEHGEGVRVTRLSPPGP
jgi:ATP-dependent RNA helicase DeaD